MSYTFYMRQAIQTKFLPCTNSRGSRVKAIAQAGSITLDWDHALNGDENHAAAAQALASKYGWKGVWHGGALPHSSGYSFVISTEPAFTIADEKPQEKKYRALADGSFIRDVS